MKAVILSFYIFLSIATSAQLRTANIFTSHMVLQRDKTVPVWGCAYKNEKVTVQFNGQTVSVKANAPYISVSAACPAGGDINP